MRIEKAIEMLKDEGYKITDKREQMLELFSGADKYLTAKDVFDHLKNDFPGISFDTIYRNLSLFAKLGILEETELSGEMLFRFNCSTSHHHHHFICLECGMTKQIETCPMPEVNLKLKGFEVTGHKFEIYGKCPDCM
ncbi:Fur family transcriptional regulator [Falsibacillus albus]|uniref:Transcriptional repressor n=1 Tax=Falsibacillus albus TaxID=2478915 RepID=A0A3L7K5A4_9BACI|nr:Fur family transcriptional regulator [Falsibacillus albus]RLQ98207.1 transcriptional repressor [Falsibacillus albus]